VEAAAAPPPLNQDRPGTGRTITMARGDWSGSWLQATIYERLLLELGYRVVLAEQSELGPEAAFAAVASGAVDLWPHALSPLHDQLLANATSDGTVGERVSMIGDQASGGAMEGVLATRSWVNATGVAHLDDIAADPDLSAEFDLDGDGIGDIVGCRGGSTCNALVDRLITTNGWNLTQLTQSTQRGEFDTMLEEATARIVGGEPTLIFGWTPSDVVAALEPGVDVVWLGVRSPNPAWSNTANVGPAQCPAQPCNTGFAASDVRVLANDLFLDANPAASRLISAVEISPVDIARQQQFLEVSEDGSDTARVETEIDRIASEWIARNRPVIETWLAEARTGQG